MYYVRLRSVSPPVSPPFPAAFLEKTVFPPPNCRGTFVENELALCESLCFWTACVVPLTYVSVLHGSSTALITAAL